MCVGRVVEGAHQQFASMGMGVSVEGVGSREGHERGC